MTFYIGHLQIKYDINLILILILAIFYSQLFQFYDCNAI